MSAGATRPQSSPPSQNAQDRWYDLIDSTEKATQRIPLLEEDTQTHLDHAIQYLESLLETFPATIDPVRDLEGFAVRRLTKALHEMVLYAKDASDV